MDYPGQVLLIRRVGTFMIDFRDSFGNILFHWSPRSSYVVRNSNFNGVWGSEERSGGLPFPIDREHEVQFTRTATGWQITIDGLRAPTFDFVQRWEGSVATIEFWGSVLFGGSTCT